MPLGERSFGNVDLAPHLQTLNALERAHPEALSDPRQRARFLLGLASPALSAFRLQKHALFGALEGAAFAQVLEALRLL